MTIDYTCTDQERAALVRRALKYIGISNAHPNDPDDGYNADNAVMAALGAYVAHRPGCPVNPCSCGLHELLDAARGFWSLDPGDL
jgi:hypothetical protein